MPSKYDDTVRGEDIADRIDDLQAANRTNAEQEELHDLQEIMFQIDNDTLLINESYFGNYAQEHAEESGQDLDGWPYSCIDWDRAADELMDDYSSLNWDGVTFYYA